MILHYYIGCFLLFMMLNICSSSNAPPYTPDWSSVTQHPNPEWYDKAKFGIYAHWGPYSVPAYGSEWYSRNMYVNGSSVSKHHIQTYGEHFGYKDFIPLFTGKKFNATEWVALYKMAGARYAGPVAEHADGFAMFNTSYSNYNAVHMGPKRDIVREMANAVRNQGLKLLTSLHHQWLWAWYPTWDKNTDCGDSQYQLTADHGGLYGPSVDGPAQFNHPKTTPQFENYFLEKILELMDNYQPDIIYFDSKQGYINQSYLLSYIAHYYNKDVQDWENKGVVITYKGHDFHVGAGVLDYERGGVADIQTSKWQTDDAMDRHSWSWVEPPSIKNDTELIGELVDIVSKNGNMLLDIPPKADGSIDDRVRHVLLRIGKWLSINGQAIYGSKPWIVYGEGPTKITPGSFHEWPIFTKKDFRFTKVHQSIFITAMAWSGDGYLVTSLNTSLGNQITNLSLVGADDLPLKWQQNKNGLNIQAFSKPPVLNFSQIVFRAHIDHSLVGFLTWNILPGEFVVPGRNMVLEWFSGGIGNEDIALEYQLSQGMQSYVDNWILITKIKNIRAYVWNVPQSVCNSKAIWLRIKALDENYIYDIISLMIR